MSQQDYDDLLNGAVNHAAELLEADSELAPFALAMQAEDGELFLVEPEVDQDTEADVAIASLRDALEEEVGRWRAVAVVADVTLEDEAGDVITAAIHIAMEHVAGDPVTCIVPYSIGEDQVELDDLVMEEGERHVFGEAVEA